MYPSPFKVWLGPEPMVAFTSPKDIAVLLSGVAGLSRAKTFAKIFRTFLGDGLLASDGTYDEISVQCRDISIIN